MKKTMKVLAVVLALVLMATAFAACGGNKDNGGDATKAPAVKVIDIKLTEETYAFGVDKNQPELLAQVNAFIKEIKENGKFDEICNKYLVEGGVPTAVKSAAFDPSKDQLVVATNAEFAPFEYLDGDNFYGIDMEIAAALAEKLGKELVINNMNFDAVCLSVGQQKCDIAMAGLTVNEKRQESVTFTDAYYEASQKLVVKGDDTTFDACKTKEDVETILNTFDANVKFGSQSGTTGQVYVEGDMDDPDGFGFAGFKVAFKGYDSHSLAVNDLMNGNLNYVVADEVPAKLIVEKINSVA